MLHRNFLSLILLILLLLPSTSWALTKEIKSGGRSYTIEDRKTYPIVFIPGMAGSKLELGGSREAWPGSITGGDASFDVLSLNPDGRTQKFGGRLLATDVVKYGAGDTSGFEGGWFVYPIYQGFYDYMATQGFALNDNPKTGKVFFDFPYDFRIDNRNWTRALEKKVDDVLDRTKSDKVIFFAHSMGGYQARLYLADASRAKKVAAVVFMGTPHHGSPMAFWSYTNGYNFGNKKLSDTKMWEVGANWPGGYQLLPDYKFVQDENGKFWSIEKTYGDGYITEQEYAHYLKAKKEGKPYTINYGLPNKRLVQDSLALHNTFGLQLPKYPGVAYYMIEGIKQPTVQYFEAMLQDVGLAKPLLKLTKVTTSRGDGTVAAGGARVEGAAKFTVPSEHGAIPSNGETQKLLTMIRSGINKEVERENTAKEVASYAESGLPRIRMAEARAKQTGTIPKDEKERGLAEALIRILFVGTPDEKKVALRDEIARQAASLFKSARVNLVIKDNKNGNDEYYLITDNYSVVASGHGRVTAPSVIVTLSSKQVFDKLLARSLDPAIALKNGDVSFSGGGFSQSIKFKAAEWINKYVLKKASSF